VNVVVILVGTEEVTYLRVPEFAEDFYLVVQAVLCIFFLDICFED
jgi:hypothetical protein